MICPLGSEILFIERDRLDDGIDIVARCASIKAPAAFAVWESPKKLTRDKVDIIESVLKKALLVRNGRLIDSSYIK